MTDQELVEQAFTMLERSYVPYSHFPVGAALEGADGVVYTGCNVFLQIHSYLLRVGCGGVSRRKRRWNNARGRGSA